MQEYFFKSTHGNIHYLHREGKFPLIFIHGIGGNARTWIKSSNFIPDDFELYLVDLLGHGKSDSPPVEYTVDLNSRIIREFIENLGIKRYGLVGNSYGGWVVLRYSIKFEEPEYIVLEDSAGLNKPVGLHNSEIVNSFIDSLVSAGNKRYVMENMIKNNVKEDFRINERDLSNLGSKTLIIWGRLDNVIPLEYGLRFKDLIRCSRIFIFEDAGHIPHMEKPFDFADALKKNLLDIDWKCLNNEK